MRTAEDICDLWRQRRNSSSKLLTQMRSVRAAYNGDLIVPLPEMDRTEKSAVANLVTQGIDQLSGRITSTVPAVDWPSMKPGDRAADRRAETRRKAQQGWWEGNRLNLKLRHRSRYLIGYAAAPVSLRPGPMHPVWEVHNPLMVYPSQKSQVDQMIPENVITESMRTRAWLISNGYEAQLMRLKDKPSDAWRGDDQFTVLTYRDQNETTQVLVPPEQINRWGEQTFHYGLTATILETYVNRCEMTPFVVPERITLDRLQGQFDQMLGMYAMQAKLMALEVIAVERGIFPDTYLVSRAGEQARFIAGPFDGRTGNVNIVAGGEVQSLDTNPGYQTTQVVDRLERAQRLTAGMPAEFGGESGSNIRTGRRGDAVLSAVIDMPIQEAQELLAASMEYENMVAASIEKHYYGTATRHVYISAYKDGKKKAKQVTYTPGQVFSDGMVNKVYYPAVGTDANGLVIAMGQRVGIGTMSKQTAAEMDPLIDNAEQEKDRVAAEALENALLQSLQEQAVSGQLPAADLARIMQLVRSNEQSLVDAVMTVQREAQERQAAQAPPGSPETMPGLAPPGMGMEQPPEVPAAIGGPPPAAENLANLFARLRQPAMTLPAEQGMGAPVA